MSIRTIKKRKSEKSGWWDTDKASIYLKYQERYHPGSYLGSESSKMKSPGNFREKIALSREIATGSPETVISMSTLRRKESGVAYATVGIWEELRPQKLGRWKISDHPGICNPCWDVWIILLPTVRKFQAGQAGIMLSVQKESIILPHPGEDGDHCVADKTR